VVCPVGSKPHAGQTTKCDGLSYISHFDAVAGRWPAESRERGAILAAWEEGGSIATARF
jgi:hypothetical protein